MLVQELTPTFVCLHFALSDTEMLNSIWGQIDFHIDENVTPGPHHNVWDGH